MRHVPHTFLGGARSCGQCRQSKAVAGGCDIPIAGGKRRIWVCSDCRARNIERGQTMPEALT